MTEKERAEKFWGRVALGDVHPIHGQCWIWTGFIMDNGYGKCNSLPEVLTHRYAWLITNGSIPDGLDVLHKCDNRMCVNPDHLFVGTHQDNMDDKITKGNQVRGETCVQHKVTEEQVREIRRRYKRYSHKHGSGALAREFGIGEVEVWRIVMLKRWEHVK